MTRSYDNDILTERQWQALTDAEAPIYKDNHGCHAYTSVMPREEGGIAVNLWEHAEDQVDAMFDDFDGADRDAEIAKRVAAALATLAFGTEFLS